MAQGVVVAMAAHNSERWIGRAIQSINKSFEGSGRQYALLIADDASTDQTLKTARLTQSTAVYRSTLGFTKASCIGEAKNRAAMMALPFLDRFPWVLWMDDDDEMLSGRLKLIDKLEDRGQRAGVGDWLHLRIGREPELVTGEWSIANRCFSPGMTAIHRDLIPKDGRYFHHAPATVFEDLSTHHLMTLQGVHWCYHQGPAVHAYHRRNESFTGPEAQSHELLRQSADYIQRFNTCSSIGSFCSVALGDVALSELELLSKSLRLTGNSQPLHVLTDSAGAKRIGRWKSDIETVVDDNVLEKNKLFPEWARLYSAPNFVAGAFLSKMRIIREALKHRRSTLYLDADQVVLRPIHDMIDTSVRVVHEGHGTMTWPHQAFGWDRHRFGTYNGGLVYFSSEGLEVVDRWEADFRENYKAYGRNDAIHGGFSDQSSMELFATQAPTSAFHPGFGVSVYRIPAGQARAVMTSDERGCISGTHDLFHHGWPLTTIHQHFRGEFRDRDGVELFTDAIGRSSHAHHRQILEWIRADGTRLRTRPRPRYLVHKVTR